MKKRISKKILSFILALLMFITTVPSACVEVLANTVSGQIDVKSNNDFYLHYTKIWSKSGEIDNYYKPQALENTTTAPDYTYMEVKTVSNNKNDNVYAKNCVPIYRISRKGGYTTVQSTVTSNSVIDYNVKSLKTFCDKMNQAYGKNVLTEKEAKMIYYVLQNGLKQFEGIDCYAERLYYLATQSLIWEIAEGKRTGWDNDATSTKYGQPVPGNLDTIKMKNGKYADTITTKKARSTLSNSYVKSSSGTPYPYYWHDWYYNIKSTCFDKAHYDDKKTSSPYPDYYGQILRACQLQSAADNTASWADGMVNNNYTLQYNSKNNKYETTITVNNSFKNIISSERGAYYDYNKIVVPINRYSSYTRSDGSYFIQHGSANSSAVSDYVVNIDSYAKGKYYHVNVKSFPDDNCDTFQLAQGTVYQNKITIMGKTVNGKYYYIRYKLKNEPDKNKYAYLKVGSKTTQNPKSRDVFTSDVLQLATYDNGTLINPQPLFTTKYSQDKLIIQTDNAMTASTFHWHCNGIPTNYYNKTFAFRGNPSASTAKEKGIQGFACGGNGITGKVTFTVTPKSTQKITVKAKIDGTTDTDNGLPSNFSDTLWDQNISDNYTIKKRMLSLKGSTFYGDENVTGVDSSTKVYLSNYIKKLNSATDKQYTVVKWTDANGNDIDFNANGVSTTTLKQGGIVYVVLKEKKQVTDEFYCDKKLVAERTGYPGSQYNIPDMVEHDDCQYYYDKDNEGWQFSYWDTIEGSSAQSEGNIPDNRKIYPGQSKTFGNTGRKYYAKYEKTSNRRVTFICGIDNALVNSVQDNPGNEYTAPDGALHLKDKCSIPDVVEINGREYSKDDITFTFAYWDKDSTSILAKDEIPNDAITPDNYKQTIPEKSTVYYAKYKVEAKKTVEFKCSVCGEAIYSVNDFGGTKVSTPDKVSYITEDGVTTTKTLLENHICTGQVIINNKTSDASSLNKNFKCYNKNADVFNYNNALEGVAVSIPTGILTEENQVTTYYIHYEFSTGITVTSHLQDEEYYKEKAESTESTEMVSDTAKDLQDILEQSSGYTTDGDIKKEAQDILNDWEQAINDRKWSSNIEWSKDINWSDTKVNSPSFLYKKSDKYSDQYYVEFVSNDKDPFDNKVIIHNTSDKFDIKYVTVTNRTGEIQTIDNSVGENGNIKTNITIDCPNGKGTDNDGNEISVKGIDSIDDLQIDVYFDVPKTEFNVTINYYGLFDENYNNITVSEDVSNGEYGFSSNPMFVKNKEVTCRILDGFTFWNNTTDEESGELYLEDNIDYEQTKLPFAGYIQTHLPGNTKIYKLDMTADNPLNGTDLDKTIYTEDNISIDLYYKLPEAGTITFIMKYDPENAKKIIEEMGKEKGYSYIHQALTYNQIEMYRDPTYNPDNSLDYESFVKEYGKTAYQRFNPSISKKEEKKYCDSEVVSTGERVTKVTWYKCKECGKYYTSQRVRKNSLNLLSPYIHGGTAYTLNGHEFTETTLSNCILSSKDEEAVTVIKSEKSADVKYYDEYNYDKDEHWTCENGHENKITDENCTHYDITEPDSFEATYKYQAYDSDRKEYFFFAVNTQNNTEYCYDHEIANKNTPYLGGDVTYEITVSRGGVTKVRVGETLNNKFLPAVNSDLIISKQPYKSGQEIECSVCGNKIEINSSENSFICSDCGHSLNFADDGIEYSSTDDEGELKFRTYDNTQKQYYLSFPDSYININGDNKKTADYHKYYSVDLVKNEYINFNTNMTQRYLHNNNGVVINTFDTDNIQVSHNRAVVMFEKDGINVHYKLNNYIQNPVQKYGEICIGLKVYKIDEITDDETLISEIYSETYNLDEFNFTYTPNEKGQYKFVPCFYTKDTNLEYTSSDKVIKKTITGPSGNKEYYYRFLDLGLSMGSDIDWNNLQILSLAATNDDYSADNSGSTIVKYTGKSDDIYFKCLKHDSSYDITYNFYNTSKNYTFFKYADKSYMTALKLLKTADFQFKIYDENKEIIETFDVNNVKSYYGDNGYTYSNGKKNENRTGVFEESKRYVSYEHDGYLYLINYNVQYGRLSLNIINLKNTDDNKKIYVTLEAKNTKSNLLNNLKYYNYLTVTNSYDISELSDANKITSYEQLTQYPVVWDYNNNISQLMQAYSSKDNTLTNKIMTVIRLDNYADIEGVLQNENNEIISNINLFKEVDFPAYEKRDVKLSDIISDTGLESIASEMQEEKKGALWFEYYSNGKYDFENAKLDTTNNLVKGSDNKLISDGCVYDGNATVDNKKCLAVDWTSNTLAGDLKEILSKVTIKYDQDWNGVVAIHLSELKYATISQKIDMYDMTKTVGGVTNNRAWMNLIENADLNTGLLYNTSNTELLNMQDVLNSLNDEQKTYFNDNTINRFTSFAHLSSNYAVNNGKYKVDNSLNKKFPYGTLTKKINKYIDSNKKVFVDSVTGSFDGVRYLTLKYKINLSRSDLQELSTFTGLVSFDNTGEIKFDGDFPVLKNNDMFNANFVKDKTTSGVTGNSNGSVSTSDLYGGSTNSVLELTNEITLKTVTVNVVLDKDVTYKKSGWTTTFFGKPTVTDNELGGKTLTFKVPVQSFKENIKEDYMAPTLLELTGNDEYVLKNIDNQENESLYFDFSSLSDEETLDKYLSGVKSINGIFLENDYYGEGDGSDGFLLSAQYIYKDTTVYITKKTNKHSVTTSITENAGTITAPITDIQNNDSKIIGFDINDDYYVSDVIVDGNSLTAKEIESLKNTVIASDGVEYEYGYTFSNINDDHDIKVICEPYKTITTDIVNGTITPTIQKIKTGDSYTVSFTPDDEYYVSEVIIDGNEDNKIVVSNSYSLAHNNEITYKNGQWTFNNISENHNIEVICEEKPKIKFISYVASQKGSTSYSRGMFDKYTSDMSSQPFNKSSKTTRNNLSISVYPEDNPALYYDGSESGYYITKIVEFSKGDKKTMDYSDPNNLYLDQNDTTYNKPRYLAGVLTSAMNKEDRTYTIYWDKIYINIKSQNTNIIKSDINGNDEEVLLEESGEEDYVKPDGNGNYNDYDETQITAIRHESIKIDGTPYNYAYFYSIEKDSSPLVTVGHTTAENGGSVTINDITGRESGISNVINLSFNSHLLQMKASIDNGNTIEFNADSLNFATINQKLTLSSYNILGVKYNTSPELKINLKEGYEIDSVSVNGKDVSLSNIVYKDGQPYYIVNNIKHDTQIDIKTKAIPLFDVDTWISNSTVDGVTIPDGTITPGSYNIRADSTSSKLISFKPRAGYYVSGVRITRTINGEEKIYTVDNVNNYKIGGDYVIKFDWDEWNNSHEKQKYKIQVTCQKEYYAQLIIYQHKDTVGISSTRSPLEAAPKLFDTRYWLRLSSEIMMSSSEILENKNTTGYYNSQDFPYYIIYKFNPTNTKPSVTLTSIANTLEDNSFVKFDYCYEHREFDNGALLENGDQHVASHTFKRDSTGCWITAEAGCYIQKKPLDGISVEFIQPNKNYTEGEQVVATFKVTNNTDRDLIDLDAHVELMTAKTESNGAISLIDKTNGSDKVWVINENADGQHAQDSTLNTKVSVPAHGSNIFYVKFVVPNTWGWYATNSLGIIPSAEIYDGNNIYTKTNNTKLNKSGYLESKSWVSVASFSENITGFFENDINGGNNFSYSDSQNDKDYQNVASWEQWSYSDKTGFVKHKYDAKLTYDDILLRPVDRKQNMRQKYLDGYEYKKELINPSQSYDEKTNMWTSKSGYSLQLNAVSKLNVTENGNDVTEQIYQNMPSTNYTSDYSGETQEAECYFPEYNFKNNTENKTTLGKLVTKNNKVQMIDYAGEFAPHSKLKEYVFGNDGELKNYAHAIPVWYPDNTNYKVQIKTSGAWTPAGALSYVGDSNSVIIKGNIFDDYKSRETSAY